MTVYLVGAGPGDPGLLTRRGAKLLARADVVLHDRLVSPAVLDLVPPTARLIDVGKDPDTPGGGLGRQEEIARLLVEHGRTSAVVVRLKGGDPFLFGRGGEEVELLARAGIPWEVVPGVTSAFGAPAVAGIPVTQRGLASAVTVVTGRVGEPGGSGGPDWEALAGTEGTLVILMGMTTRAAIADALMRGGRAPETPVAVIERGTTVAQRVARTTLAGLAGVELGSPAVIVIGPVAALGADGPARPRQDRCAGRTVVVTRSGRAGSGPGRHARARRSHRPRASADTPGRPGGRRGRAPGGGGGGGGRRLGRAHLGQRGRSFHGRAARRPGPRVRARGRGRAGHGRRAAPGGRRTRPRAGGAQRPGAGRGVPKSPGAPARGASSSPAPTSRPTPSSRAWVRRGGRSAASRRTARCPAPLPSRSCSRAWRRPTL